MLSSTIMRSSVDKTCKVCLSSRVALLFIVIFQRSFLNWSSVRTVNCRWPSSWMESIRSRSHWVTAVVRRSGPIIPMHNSSPRLISVPWYFINDSLFFLRAPVETEKTSRPSRNENFNQYLGRLKILIHRRSNRISSNRDRLIADCRSCMSWASKMLSANCLIIIFHCSAGPGCRRDFHRHSVLLATD